MAMDMYKDRMIDAKTAILRVAPQPVGGIITPMLDHATEKITPVIAKDCRQDPEELGAGCFSSEEAVENGQRKARR